MDIQPSSITVGEQPGTPTPYPTLTPAEVVMSCYQDGSVEYVYDILIKRKKSQDFDFRTFAELHIINNVPQFSQNAPSDITSKNPRPRLSGSISSPSSNRLTVSFYVYQMTCQDEAMYQCSVNYKPIGYDSLIDTNTNNLTVTSK